MRLEDVTDQVRFDEIDGESLSLRRCVCGEEYPPWDRILSIYDDLARPCGKCGARLVFEAKVHVYKVSG